MLTDFHSTEKDNRHLLTASMKTHTDTQECQNANSACTLVKGIQHKIISQVTLFLSDKSTWERDYGMQNTSSRSVPLCVRTSLTSAASPSEHWQQCMDQANSSTTKCTVLEIIWDHSSGNAECAAHSRHDLAHTPYPKLPCDWVPPGLWKLSLTPLQHVHCQTTVLDIISYVS